MVVATVGWGGLLLGLAGWFGLLGVGACAFVGVVVVLAGRPRPQPVPAGMQAPDGCGRVAALTVFVAAAAVLLPGYDAAIYGSDATLYRAAGVHLARTGSLPIEDPLLAQLWSPVADLAFPPVLPFPDSPRLRSPGGLAYLTGSARVWSAFSQLPSVWIGAGWLLGGVPGGRCVSPLLAAAALTAIWLLLRRHAGLAVATLTAGMLAVLLPEMFLARLGLSEVPAQLLLWGGLLALSRWYETRAATPALAAGLGLGLLAMARPEYLAFLPLAIGLAWALPGTPRVRLPRATTIVVGAAWLCGLVLLLCVPSHYRAAGVRFLLPLRAFRETLPGTPPWAWGVAAAVLVGLVLLAWVTRRWRAVLASTVLTMAGATWVALFFLNGRSPSEGQMLSVLDGFVAWPVWLLGALGLPPLAAILWRAPATRLALLVALVAGAHFAVDLHASTGAVWAGRRMLPAMLPVLVAGVAAAITALGRRAPVAGLALAAVVLGATMLPAVRWAGNGWFDQLSEQVAAVDRFVPGEGEDTIVLVDPGLTDALLDVSLWLEHGRSAVQLRMGADQVVTMFIAAQFRHRRVVVLRHGFLPPPVVPGVAVQPLGEIALRVRAPTASAAGIPTILLPIRAYEMRFVAG